MKKIVAVILFGFFLGLVWPQPVLAVMKITVYGDQMESNSPGVYSNHDMEF